MAARKTPSLEELVRRYDVAERQIDVTDLEAGMVLRSADGVRIVIGVSYKNSTAGPIVVVECVSANLRFSPDEHVQVWHREGKPFFVDGPPEMDVRLLPGDGGGSSGSPVEDAAGIVPVWRGPKRVN